MKFAGKVAIITGAGAGIGKVYAQTLAREGAAVVIADLDERAGKSTAGEIVQAGGKAVHTVTDVASEEEIEKMVRAAVEVFGGVDYLVNNAARHLTAYAVPPTQLPRDKWREMLEINVTAPMICAAHCRPYMKARGGGAIVNQSSQAAYKAAGSYGVSKMALNALTVALATEFAPDNIRVNGIAPGMVDSPAAVADLSLEHQQRVIDGQLIKRRGRMTDPAAALVFLLSDDSSFITGQTILVDGGTIRRM